MRLDSYKLYGAIAAVGLVACDGPETGQGRGADGPAGQPPAVEAVEVRRGSFPLEERLSGAVRARNQTEIYAEVSGTIEAVYADDGNHVSAGDPLVQLRARDFQERVRQVESGLDVATARVRQAEANLFRAETNLERVQSIVERGLAAAAELDTARADAISAEADLTLMQAQRDQAEALVEERQAALAETLVRAPIDGIVGGRNAEVGQQATTSAPLFTIGDVGRMQVDVTLTQQMLGYIDTGTPVNIYTDAAPDEIIDAEITRISPFLHAVSHTTRAQIYVPEQENELRPGMFVTVDVLYGQSEEAPLVPNSAIYRHPRDGREGVFLTSLAEALRDPETSQPLALDGPPRDPVGPVAVRFVPVEVIARGRMASAIRGVQPGDWVVTLGHHLLVNDDGQQAIVEPTPWDHILNLQQMQSRNLIDIIREKQEQIEAQSSSPN